MFLMPLPSFKFRAKCQRIVALASKDKTNKTRERTGGSLPWRAQAFLHQDIEDVYRERFLRRAPPRQAFCCSGGIRSVKGQRQNRRHLQDVSVTEGLFPRTRRELLHYTLARKDKKWPGEIGIVQKRTHVLQPTRYLQSGVILRVTIKVR